MKTKLVHLSDLHLGIVGKKNKRVNVEQKLWNLVLEQIHNENPDAVVVSGDLANFPCKEDYEVVNAFLLGLKAKFPILCVPGNLDYLGYTYYPKTSLSNNPNIEIDFERFLRFKEPVVLIGKKESGFVNKNFAVKVGDNYYLVVEDRRKDEVRSYRSSEAYSVNIGFEEPEIAVNDVNLIGFDSARDIGKNLVGILESSNFPKRDFYAEQMVDGAITSAHTDYILDKKHEGLSITVMHHPIFPIKGANGIYGCFRDGELTAKKLIEKGVNIALCGHKHLQGYSKQSITLDSGEQKDFHIFAAGTLFSKDIKKPYKDNSYNIVEIDGNQVRVSYKEIRTKNSGLIAEVKID